MITTFIVTGSIYSLIALISTGISVLFIRESDGSNPYATRVKGYHCLLKSPVWPIMFFTDLLPALMKDYNLQKQRANEIATDLLLEQLDDTLTELEKKKEKDAKAEKAKEKFDLLMKEMAQ